MSALPDEIGRLRQVLIDNDIDPDPVAPKAAAISQPDFPRVQLSTEEKIRLFLSLFRVREDVYAARWESPDGRHGYPPVAQHDWKAYKPPASRIESGLTKRPENMERSLIRRFTII